MKQARGKDLKTRTLAEWFKKLQPRDFSGLKANYVARYNALEDFLEKEVHPLVAIGAAVQDQIFLNEHGQPHITAVIKRVSDLATNETFELSAYEVYILLAAIQLHDIGNILGRSDHEARVRDFRGRLDALLGDDSAEKRLIRAIAEAHGGKHKGEKDTIGQLVEVPVLNQKVRARFLAGLLRFADELADDRQRVSTFAIDNEAIPESSRLFHRYSASLQSVMIDMTGSAVGLHYELNRADVEDEFTPDGKSRYLIEEIFDRSVKMHRERIYCMRFLRPTIQIDSINVKITVYESSNSPDQLTAIGYRLEDSGYPRMPDTGIYDLCPELSRWDNGEPLNGRSLLARITERQR